jgi:hypothetical protein
MLIQTSFKVVEASSVKPGDLVKFSYGENSIDLAIVFEVDEHYSKVIVLRTSSEDSFAPYADQFRRTGLCVSYGSDWIIEPVDDLAAAQGFSSGVLGSIAFLPGEPILTLGHSKQAARPPSHVFNLATLSFYRGTPHDAYMVKRWKLWLNEDHQRGIGAQPLLDFVASPLAPR